jgi:hypothetical protein
MAALPAGGTVHGHSVTVESVMKTRHLSFAGAVLSAFLLSGCAAVMMTGASGLPIAMLAAGAMDEVGLLDDLDSLTDPEMNPALLRHPDLGDPRLSADQARLIRNHGPFARDIEGGLSMAGAKECAMDEETRWRLAQQTTRADYEKAIGVIAPPNRPRVLQVEAELLEGECRDGRPEGPFVVASRFATVTQAGNMTIRSTDRRRLTGMMRDGQLEGELVSAGHTETTSSTTKGRIHASVTHSIARYSGGEMEGASVRVAFVLAHDGDGEVSQIVSSVTQTPEPNRHHTTTYVGDMIQSEVTIVDGAMHGWRIQYPVSFIEENTAPAQRTCYQRGQVAPDSACASSTS